MPSLEGAGGLLQGTADGPRYFPNRLNLLIIWLIQRAAEFSRPMALNRKPVIGRRWRWRQINLPEGDMTIKDGCCDLDS
jgi:hypothetical protein